MLTAEYLVMKNNVDQAKKVMHLLYIRISSLNIPAGLSSSIGMQTVAGSILTSDKTFFHWDLVMKKFYDYSLILKEQLLVTGERMGIRYW